MKKIKLTNVINPLYIFSPFLVVTSKLTSNSFCYSFLISFALRQKTFETHYHVHLSLFRQDYNFQKIAFGVKRKVKDLIYST